jgi:hypothetical protein
MDESGEIVELKPAHDTWVAERVPDRVDHDGALLGSACRCTEATGVRLSWIRKQLDAGARRVVADESAGALSFI